MISQKPKIRSNNKSYKFYKADGITLISLVITIILLIILAGIAINLSIGENGIFRRAQEAKLKEEQSSAREKLELALLDLQTLKETDKSYNEKEYINNYLETREMNVEEDIVTVGNWKFEIDRTVPKIIENSEQIETKVRVLISVPYVGTRSAKIKIQNVTNEEEVEQYTYMLNEEELISTSEKEYDIQDYLDPETTYQIKVIAKYKDDLTIESNEVTIKTEPRTYLFNNGDTCNEITGGWSAMAGPDKPNYPEATMAAPEFTFVEDEIGKGMNIHLEPQENIYTQGILKTNKKINYKQYRKICFEAVAALSWYSSASIITINASTPESFYPEDGEGDGCTICYEYPISDKTLFEINMEDLKNKQNIENIEDIEDVYFYIQVHRNNGPAGCCIYNVWLEK